MAISTPTAPLSALDLYPPEYGFQEDYKSVTGKAAPPLDRAKPLKTWFDPKALTATNGFDASTGVFYTPTSAFYPVLDLSQTPDQKQSGDWTVTPDNYLFTRLDAATVNLMSNTPSSPDHVATPGQTTAPIPRRGLDSAEQIKSLSLFDLPQVINLALYAAEQEKKAEAEGKFTQEDRALLHGIGKALNVQGA